MKSVDKKALVTGAVTGPAIYWLPYRGLCRANVFIACCIKIIPLHEWHKKLPDVPGEWGVRWNYATQWQSDNLWIPTTWCEAGLGRIQNSIRSLMLPPPPWTDRSLDTIWYFIPRSDCGTKRGHKFASHELLIKLSFPNSQSIFHPTSIEHRGTNCNTAPPTIFNHGYSTEQHIEENPTKFTFISSFRYILLSHFTVTLPLITFVPRVSSPASRGLSLSLSFSIYLHRIAAFWSSFCPGSNFTYFTRSWADNVRYKALKIDVWSK